LGIWLTCSDLQRNGIVVVVAGTVAVAASHYICIQTLTLLG